MTTSATQQTDRKNQLMGLAAAILAAVLISLLLSAGTVELLSATVPVWLVAVVSYLLGVAAAWGYLRK